MALSYMLDTNICIYIAKQKPEGVIERFEELTVGEVGMSSITYGELYYGASKSHYPDESKAILDDLISLIPPLPLPTDSGMHYGDIRNNLQKQGKIIGNNDLWIAAHVLAIDVTLVTYNMKEFKRIPKLKVENWVDQT